MALNPPSLRLPFTLPKDTDPNLRRAVEFLFNGLTNHEQAFRAIGVPTSSTVTNNYTTSTSGGGSSSVVGAVNDQIGVTAYTTQQSDYGAEIIVGDSSAVAVTLSSIVQTPWFTMISNDSSATATLSPSSGTIYGDTTVESGELGVIFFDGANFWSKTVNRAITQLTGDVTAGPGYDSQVATVVGIQTVPVDPIGPLNGQVLIYDSGATAWIPSDIPASPSGTYYLDSTASTIPTYYSLVPTYPDGTQNTLSASGNNTSGQVLVGAFASKALNTTLIADGVWTPKVYASVDSLSQSPQMVLYIYKRTTGGTETLLGSEYLYLSATGITEYISTIEIPTTSVEPTDVIVFKVYLLAGGSSTRTLTIYFDGTTNVSHINAPIPSINAIKSEPVNSQTGTSYTIPDSARGYLITFNNASPVAVSLPQAGASTLYLNGWFCDVVNIGAGTVTITPTTSTINLNATQTLTTGQGGRIVSDGANYYFV